MRKYCKAYYLKDLRQFRSWTEKREGSEEELSGNDVVYLWDDFNVVRSPVIPDKGLSLMKLHQNGRLFVRKR